MKSHAEEQNAIRQYLLGLLLPEQWAAVEERLLTDEAFYEEILLAEDELIDQYMAGRISEAERESFESHFLITPERRKKVRFAHALKRCIAARNVGGIEGAPESPEDDGKAAPPFYRRLTFLSWLHTRRPALAFSLAAAALLLFLVGSWAWMRVPSPRQGPRRIFAVTLSPGLIRDSGEITKFRVAPDSDEVQFRLSLKADEYQSYRAVLLEAEGSTIMTVENLRSEPSESGKAVVLRASSQSISPGDYQLKLSGVTADGTSESIGVYPFRVLKGER